MKHRHWFSFSLMNPRRHFRFSLRTLLILVTLLCVWMGWQIHVVRERKAIWLSLRTMFLLLTVLSVWLGWNLNRVRQRERLLSLAGVLFLPTKRARSRQPIPI